MRIVPVAAVLALALVAAGCGARSNKPFTAQGTVACLKQKNFTEVTRRPAQVGVIAAFAANGGIKASAPSGNVVTIAFTQDETAVDSTEKAFRLHAPPALRPHITDVMRSSRNAVLVWTTTPSDEDESAAEGCLAP